MPVMYESFTLNSNSKEFLKEYAELNGVKSTGEVVEAGKDVVPP